MRALLVMIFAAFMAMAPSVGYAQTAPAPVAPPTVEPAVPPAAATTVFGLPPAQALAVGVGIFAGGIGMSALSSGPFATAVGAVAGALIGNWWYATQPTVTSRTSPLRHQMSADADL